MYFKDLNETKEYAIKNPGSTFIKNKNGSGFMLKNNSEDFNNYKNNQDDIKIKDNIKQGRPSRSGLSWRDNEIAQLIKLHNSGQSINDISNELKRTALAVASKLKNLELISETEHQKYLADHYSTPLS